MTDQLATHRELTTVGLKSWTPDPAEFAANLDAGFPREVAVGDVIRYVSPPNKHYPRTEPLSITGRVWLVTESRAFFRCLTSCRHCAPPRRRFTVDRPSHAVHRTWTNWERC